jgi:hypothetical protein
MGTVVNGPEFGLRYWENNWLVAVRGAEDTVDRNGPIKRLADLISAY